MGPPRSVLDGLAHEVGQFFRIVGSYERPHSVHVTSDLGSALGVENDDFYLPTSAVHADWDTRVDSDPAVSAFPDQLSFG
jgi:hypothetical protein